MNRTGHSLTADQVKLLIRRMEPDKGGHREVTTCQAPRREAQGEN